MAGAITIATMETTAFGEVAAINAECAGAVSRLREGEAASLAGQCELALTARIDDTVTGYLYAMASGSAYAGEEFLWFAERLDCPFLYIDQVAVAVRFRRVGIGAALYRAAEAWAGANDIEILCCEVNRVPPNPESMAFHRTQGYRDAGKMRLSDGRRVAMLTKSTG